MPSRMDIPSIYVDEIKSVVSSENLVRVTAASGKHTLNCVLRPEEAERVHRELGLLLRKP